MKYDSTPELTRKIQESLKSFLEKVMMHVRFFCSGRRKFFFLQVITLVDTLFMTLKNELISMKTDVKQIVDRISVLQSVNSNIDFMQKHSDWFFDPKINLEGTQSNNSRSHQHP